VEVEVVIETVVIVETEEIDAEAEIGLDQDPVKTVERGEEVHPTGVCPEAVEDPSPDQDHEEKILPKSIQIQSCVPAFVGFNGQFKLSITKCL